MFSRRSPATSPRHLSPNPRGPPSQPHFRSRSSSLPSSSSYAYTPPASRQIQSEEALRTIKALEGVLVAWNEYRLALSQQGRTGRRLATAMRELSGRMDREGPAASAIRPTAETLDPIADLTISHSRWLETTYNEVNSEASRYFQNLARQVRDHDAYLANEGKRAMKSEKAYRKASKVMTDGAIEGSGLEAMKDALKLEVETASQYHANLLGDAQAAILSKVSAGLAGIIHPTVAYHSEGLRIATERLGEVEHFRALSAAQWRDLSLPEIQPTAVESSPSSHPHLESSATAALSAKAEEALAENEMQSAYVLPVSADPRLASVPVRPRLPLPYPSSQPILPPAMRSLNSLPPPPMYASSSSLSIPQHAPSPASSNSSILPPGHYAQPLDIPAITPRRRVSDIVGLHDPISAVSHQPSLRRVSMPPQAGIAPGGPRPRPKKLPTLSTSTSTSLPNANPLPGTAPISMPALDAGLSASTSANSSSIATAPPTPSSLPAAQTRGSLGLQGAREGVRRKRQVSFGSAKDGDQGAGSFPWGLASGGDELGDPRVDRMGQRGDEREVGAGVLHPSPRRVPSLSPELRGMMLG